MLHKLLIGLFVVFLMAYIFQASYNMVTIPFHDFDEAHRAEKAKKMKEYFSFLVPLSGSPQDRTNELRVPVKENPELFLYYHPERPPFVYWLMIGSTSIFGPSEWAYRLPSFLMALLTIGTFLYFGLKQNKNYIAISVGLLALITSADLWLSGEYAQLDTSLTFFLFLSLISLTTYIEKRRPILIIISGLSFALSILSKGQPAIIFIFPLLFLLVSRKLKIKDFLKFCASAAIILVPWLFLLNLFFGLVKVAEIFTTFAASSTIIEFSFIKAPIFWYLRWWFDSLRPGWSLFLAFFALDLIRRNFSWKKIVFLSYIFGGLLFFSLAVNKIWWYVLPLVPAMAYYLHLSVKDYLDKKPNALINLSLAVVVGSLPLFLDASNTKTLIFGIFTVILEIIILKFPIVRNIPKLNLLAKQLILFAGLFSGLVVFLVYFPAINPYHHNTKYAAGFYKNLPGKKCLYFKGMPPETALFYSNAGEILPLINEKSIFPNCDDYLITPDDMTSDTANYYYDGKLYYVKDRPLLFQKGKMKLIKL